MKSSVTQVRSIHDPKALHDAMLLLIKGEPIGIFNRGVCAIWGDGRNIKFYESVTQIKGEERGKKPLATTLRTKDFLAFIDKKSVPRFLRHMLNAQDLAARIGSLCFLRIPIGEKFAKSLPHYVLSKSKGVYEMQNWDAYGHNPTGKFIDLLINNKITLPAVTSMNYSGDPEIVDQAKGIKFSKEKGIKMFLTDEKDPGIVKGSYTIISIEKNGLRLVRDGNVPGHVFTHLLESNIDVRGSIPSKFPQVSFPKTFFRGLRPSDARNKIISYVYNI